VARSEDPDATRALLGQIQHSVAERRHFATFDAELTGGRYQVVALLTYADPFREQLQSIVGFVVNLDWVRSHYFQELVAQVLQMQGPDPGLLLSVLDASGTPVTGARADEDSLSSSRQFAMLFFNPSIVALDPPSDLKHELWTARATISGDTALAGARVGARRTLSVAAISTMLLAVGFALTVRAIRANSRLAAMRSEFVSAVTHELKTPIATIRAACETLAAGRRVDSETSREYAQLAVHEAKRLTRLIDNLLAYARITDLTEAYSFETLDLRALAQQSLKEFASQLSTSGFDVDVSVPPDLPRVTADRPSMMLAIGNLVDNAIRYSKDRRHLTLAARAVNGAVILDVSDEGVGIPPEEIQQATKRFFRGRDAVAGGSGLGLSIAQRIVSDHAGTLSISSEVGVGTTVSISLPRAGESSETAHLDS
jgi:signal transduction histidine kinase